MLSGILIIQSEWNELAYQYSITTMIGERYLFDIHKLATKWPLCANLCMLIHLFTFHSFLFFLLMIVSSFQDLHSLLLESTSSSNSRRTHGARPSSRRRLVTPPSNWPHEGTVVFDKVVLSYRADLPPALKDVSFVIRGHSNSGTNSSSHNSVGGRRVAIVGRTGGGKIKVHT